MSGHSKWSTIKHKKAAQDAKRGKVFSRLSKGISIAIKTGGGPNPEMNHKLRAAIDEAKAANMPKENIERILSSAANKTLEEVVYQGFGPGNFAVIVETATDNKNRTLQEIRMLFDRGGGSLAQTGAASYNFQKRGYLLIKKNILTDEETLNLIDAGVEDYEETQDGVEVYVSPANLYTTKEALESKGFTIASAKLIQKPSTFVKLSGPEGQKALKFLEELEDHDDVQEVFANVDIEE